MAAIKLGWYLHYPWILYLGFFGAEVELGLGFKFRSMLDRIW